MTESDLRDDLPGNWDVRRLKTVAELRTSNVDKSKAEHERPVRLCNYTDVYYSDQISDATGYMQATATSAEIEKFRLMHGDVLLTKDSETADDIAVPAYVARDFHDVLCGYHLAIVRPSKQIDGKYLYYSLLTDRIGDQFMIGANGITRFGLSQDVLKNALLPVPPLPIQRAIADFLDHEVARIDSLIEKKRRLLELLDEQRTAVITSAVTRGVDPDAPMKDSGLEWIGEIPEQWQVLALKRLWFGTDYGISDSGREGGRYPVLTMGNIEAGEVTVPHDRGVDEVDRKLLLKPGDLLFNRTNSRELVGKVGLYAGEADSVTFASYLVRLRPRPFVSSQFMKYLLNSKPILAEARARSLLSINQANLNPTRYGEIPVPVPPEREQEEIAGFLNGHQMHLATVQDRITSAMSRLQEYRTALISAAVTGKIDVHEKVRPEGAWPES